MLNIFFISNDTRVKRLVEHFQPFFKSKIRTASDFDQGLKEVFENRPDLVFIESFIGAVSGETVARHIKSLLGADSPRIIFMGERGQKGKAGSSWCDDWILYGDSDESFRNGFSDLIAAGYPDDWREISSEMAARSAGVSREVAPEHAEAGDAGGSEAREEWDIPDSALPGMPVEGHEKPLPATAAPETGAAGAADLKPEAETAPIEESPEYQSLGIETFRAEGGTRRKEFPARRSRLRALLLMVCLLAGAAVWVHYLQGGEGLVGKAPARPVSVCEIPRGPAAPPERPAVGVTALPAVIRPEWRDPSYARANPGWDRYVSAGYEFKVFRENGFIRALQVVSTAKQGITDSFLGALLREMGHGGPLPEGTVEKRDGFLVKKVVIDGFAELVTYREEGAERAKALVLELSP